MCEQKSPQPPCCQFIVSAPGKVILFGEHAVVYGHPAIAVSINLRCYFQTSVKASTGSALCFRFRNLSNSQVILNNPIQYAPSPEDTSEQLLSKAWNMVSTSLGEPHLIPNQSPIACSTCICYYLMLRVLQQTNKCQVTLLTSDQTICIDVNSDIPVRTGLGSSAAFCVSASVTLLCLCGALPLESNVTLTDEQKELIKSLSHEAESIVHGTPSGIDTAIAVQGGGICFTRHGTAPTVQRLCTPPGFTLRLLLVDSKIDRSTAAIVRAVAERRSCEPERIGRIMSAIGDVVEQALDVLSGNQPISKLGSLVSKNHALLVQLGVSCSALDDIVKELNNMGLMAKLTGAGGGGCVIGLMDPPNSEVTDVFEKAMRRMRFKGLWVTNASAFVDPVFIQLNGIENLSQ